MAATVLVTGAAGVIGSATALALRARGYRVVGLDEQRRPRARPRRLGSSTTFSTPWGTERLLAESPMLDGLQHVVAIAGGPTEEEVGRLDPADVPVDVFAASVQLNLVAQYVIVRAGAGRTEVETPGADRSITLISSINALRGYGMPGYSSAKAGLLGPHSHSRCPLDAAE